MGRCVVSLPLPKFYIILLNHPSGTYVKMLHHWVSIIGLRWPSTQTIAMQTNNSARAKSEAISGGFKCGIPLPWSKPHIMVLNHSSRTNIKYVLSPEIYFWAYKTLNTNYRHICPHISMEVDYESLFSQAGLLRIQDAPT